MPQGMSRRMNNTSSFMKHNNQILWKVSLIFILTPEYPMSELLKCDSSLLVNQSNAFLRKSYENMNEDMKITELLDTCFEHSPDNAVLRHALRAFKSCRSNLKVFLQKLPSNANKPLFYEISNTFTIRECLQGNFSSVLICAVTLTDCVVMRRENCHRIPDILCR